jgi:hypothetical protein
MNRQNFPQGPLTTSSLTRFSDIVVGHEEGIDCINGQVVMRIYGSLINSQNITTACLRTNPGGAFLSNQTLTNLALPVNPTDAANKEYVDSVAAGLIIKSPVKAATTTNIVLSGVQVIDGYATSVGDRILVKDQTLPVENGLYNVALGAWTRTADLSIGSAAAKTTVQVENGTVNKNSTWVCTSTPPADITGTDPLYWTLFIAGIVPGAGLSQTGNVLNVNVDNIGIQINGLNQLEIKPGGITNADLQNSSITINTSDGVAGGAIVSLGSSVNLIVDSTVVRTFGLQTISGNKLFNDPIGLMVGINGVMLTPAPLTTTYSFTFPVDGGAAGQVLSTDGTGTTSWISGSGLGDVVGPASSTDNAIARFDGITGKLIQNSLVIISDLGSITGVQNLTVNGTTDTNALNINSESISGQRIFSGYDSIGLTTISSSYQTLVINTNTVIDTGYINTLGQITIASVGTYDVFYHVQFQTLNNSAGQFASITAILELDTGGGFNPIAGSGSSCFIIEQNGNLINPGTGKEVIVNITVPNSIIRVRFARTVGTTTGRTKPGESSLIIKRLRP